MILNMFRIYRLLDLGLIVYFAFFFGSTNQILAPVAAQPIGLLIAALLAWRLLKSLRYMRFVFGLKNTDSVLFDLKDCTHHHRAIQRRGSWRS